MKTNESNSYDIEQAHNEKSQFKCTVCEDTDPPLEMKPLLVSEPPDPPFTNMV